MGVGAYTDARTGPDKVLGKLYHKSSQGQSNLTNSADKVFKSGQN